MFATGNSSLFEVRCLSTQVINIITVHLLTASSLALSAFCLVYSMCTPNDCP